MNRFRLTPPPSVLFAIVFCLLTVGINPGVNENIAIKAALASSPEGQKFTRRADNPDALVLPERFLRRWDPITIFFKGNQGRQGAEDYPENHVTFEPVHPGVYRWLDAKTLQFRPVEPWPPLTRFTVKTSDGSASLQTLMSPPSGTVPAAGAENLDPIEEIALTFTEPLNQKALARMISITLTPLPGTSSEGGVRLSQDDFTIKDVERASPSAPATYVLQLKEPVPAGTKIEVRFRLSLDDESDKSFSRVTFSTAQPFRVVSAGTRTTRYPVTPSGSRYPKEQAIRETTGTRTVIVEFNTPLGEISPLEGRNLVRFTPAVDGLSYYASGRKLIVKGNFDWDTLYRVNIVPNPIGDKKGRILEMEGESELFLHFASQPDYLKWGVGQGIMERYGPRMIPLKGRGFERVDLRIYPVDPLDRSLWPFPSRPVEVREDSRPPGPGEEPREFNSVSKRVSLRQISDRIKAFGSPPLSRVVNLPLRRKSGGASFGLDLSDSLNALSGENRPGHFLVGIRKLDGSDARSWMRVQVTDLALTTVEEPYGIRFVVTSLSTGEPVSGAVVEVQGWSRKNNSEKRTVFIKGSTGSDGQFGWNARTGRNWDYHRAGVDRITVIRNGDILVLNTNNAPSGYRDNLWSSARGGWLAWITSRGDLSGREERTQLLGHIFTERPVYKPEEKVHIKGYVRQRHKGVLSGPGFTDGYVVINGPGNLEWRYPVTLDSEFGSYYHLFEEEKLPTGVYRAHFEDKNRGVHGTVSFRKEAYRIPRFEVQLHSDNKVPLDRNFDLTLTATYYAGGRVAERPVQWRVTQFPYAWTPEEREGFFYSSDGRFSRTSRFETTPALQRQDITDEEGSASITIDPTIEKTAQPRTYVVEATVTGADDQTVTATRRVIGLPPFVLGLKVPRYIERARSINPEVVVVGPDGKTIAGQSVTVRLLHRQWHSVLKAADFSDGEPRYITDIVDKKIFEKTITSNNEPLPMNIPIEEAGVYVVEVESLDRLGRAQVVAVDLYAGGDEPVAWPKPTAGVFTVTTDKSNYDPGDQATFILSSPFQSARALAVVEAPEGNQYHWVRISGGTGTFKLPVKNTYVPRLPVHFILMRGRIKGTGPVPGGTTDLGKPTTVASTSWVKVNSVDNRIKVELDLPEQSMPGKKVPVTINLTDNDGKPLSGQVTLWLVDQAVLALGKEQRLDPLPDFITDVTTRLFFRDTRNLVFGFIPFLEEPGGGMAAAMARSILDNTTVRRRFETVPYFNPNILVGKDGRAQVIVHLPDNLTNFKVRAKAISGWQRFGFGVDEIAVRLPVIVQPALPRFVRPGDFFTATAIGRVVEGEGGPGAAEMKVEGASIIGPAMKEIDLVPNRPERLEFPVEVPTPPLDKEGRLSYAEVVIKAAVQRLADGASDGFEVKLPIRDDRDRITFRQMDDLQIGKPIHIPALPEIPRPGSLRRSVLLSDQPGLIRMAAGLSFLLEYPFGCTEQRVSRALTQLSLKRFREILHQEGGEEELDRSVNSTLEWLASAVDPNGLVSYWPGSRGYVSLSAWVLEFLVEAREAGYPVDQEMFDNLLRTLERSLRSDYGYFIDGEAFTERTMSLRALARAGRFNQAYASELSRKAQYLNLESVANILYASAGRSAEKTMGKGLAETLLNGVIFRLYQGRDVYSGLQDTGVRNDLILPGETRTVSRIVRALSKSGTLPDRLQIMVDALVTLGRGDGWGTTNANSASLLALTEFLQPPLAGSSAKSFSIQVGQIQEIVTTDKNNPVGHLTFGDPGEGTVVLDSSAEPGGAVLRMESSYIPSAEGSQVQPVAQGFVVSREHQVISIDGAPPRRIPLEKGGTSVTYLVADVLEEKVTVVNPVDRHFVAIVVPLAAGMEPMNPNLATSPPEAMPTGKISLAPTYAAYLDDQVAFYYDSLPKGNYDFYFRTRANVPGKYIQPAAKAEMMYDGSVRGNSAGARVIIEKAAP